LFEGKYEKSVEKRTECERKIMKREKENGKLRGKMNAKS
jgi:hypothetical protein